MVRVNVVAFGDASLTALRVFREVAERGTLTAAATALGYTQSAVSRRWSGRRAPRCCSGATTGFG
ncbi:LysR family transcriptional regulator [Nocardia sp. NPDC059228]|uniref:LysR family transcriptional regulator n=1 Tax=Nocardia sp. NPDC059228 TaxID=3346777 RepID=UPI0036BA4750